MSIKYNDFIKEFSLKRIKASFINSINAIQTDVYEKDIVFSFKSSKKSNHLKKNKNTVTKRNKITCFSYKSRKRLQLLLRNAFVFTHTLTLTYPAEYSTSGRDIKRHINNFTQFLRRQKVRYVWVLEFQERGAAHFHFLIDKEIDKNLLSYTWYKIVSSGDVKHLKAGTRIEKIKNVETMIRYMIRYAKKLEQKAVPASFLNVGRFWASSQKLLSSVVYVVKGNYYNLCRKLRLFRRWYKSKMKCLGYKWRWSGYGFVCWDGVKLLNQLRSLAL